MPRSLWNGTIAFGLMRVPVKLHTATDSRRISFRERHAADGAAIEHRRVCTEERKEVPYEEVVKGFEVASGSYVVLDKDELAIADGPKARIVEIDHFVAEEEIDPIFYERSYYLSPGKLGEDAYRVLHGALLRSGKVGIGRFVFHNKEHLAAVRALPDALAMQTMRYADEIVPERQVRAPRPHKKATKLELDTARLLIDQLADEFEPNRYEDTYRDAVMKLIERKARGEAIEPPAREQVTPAGDLLEVLKQSIERNGARGRGTGRRAAANAHGRDGRRASSRKPAGRGSSSGKGGGS